MQLFVATMPFCLPPPTSIPLESIGVVDLKIAALSDMENTGAVCRIVQWEDGSMQLFVGSEVLDLQERDTSANNTHLFARHKEVMQVCSGTSVSECIRAWAHLSLCPPQGGHAGLLLRLDLWVYPGMTPTSTSLPAAGGHAGPQPECVRMR